MKKLLLVIWATWLFSLSNVAFGEYRAYQYIVRSKYAYENERSYIVTSSLDPISYVAYHGGNDSIRVDLMRSWMCPGNTAQQETCSAPGDELAQNNTLQQLEVQ